MLKQATPHPCTKLCKIAPLASGRGFPNTLAQSALYSFMQSSTDSKDNIVAFCEIIIGIGRFGKVCLRFINFGCCPYHIALGLYEGGTVIIRLISISVSKLIKADSTFSGLTALYYVICVFRFDITLIYASTIFVRIFVLANTAEAVRQ